MQPEQVPQSLAEAIHRELAPNEGIAWIGQPDRYLSVKSALSSFWVGVFMTAFAAFWTNGVCQSSVQKHGSPDWFMLVFGLAFLCFVWSQLLAPLWAWWRAGRTVYPWRLCECCVPFYIPESGQIKAGLESACHLRRVRGSNIPLARQMTDMTMPEQHGACSPAFRAE